MKISLRGSDGCALLWRHLLRKWHAV